MNNQNQAAQAATQGASKSECVCLALGTICCPLHNPFSRRTPAATTGDGELPPLLTDDQINAMWSDAAVEAIKQAGTGIGNADVGYMLRPEIFARSIERAAIEADRAQRQAAPASAQPADHWTCFHCGESFTDRESAALHFGSTERQEPICGVSQERYREMELRMEAYNAEDADIHRQMYAMETKHQQALRRAEEDGYAKGLRDAVRFPDDVEAGAQPDQRESAAVPACRNQGGICACRSGGSFGGCAMECAASPAAQPVARSIEKGEQ